MQTASSVFKTMPGGGFTLSLKNHKDKEYGIGIPRIYINGTEAEAQKWSHMVNYFSTKVPRKSNGKNKKTLSIKTSY